MKNKNNFKKLVMANRNESLQKVESIYIKDCDYKWVGGVYAPNNRIYGIPNKSNKILEIDPDNNSYELWGDIKTTGLKNWSGGCCWKDGFIYGFPRSSPNLLKIDIEKRECYEIPLNLNCDCVHDHHYSGVVTSDGIVYQPPASNNTILQIDLNTYVSKEIVLKKRLFRKAYYGGILAPNGRIYFFPRGHMTRIMVFEPETEKITYCKGILTNVSVVSAVIAEDGMIYAFSSYASGILKINPNEDKAKIILKNEVNGGYFGTQIGFNGKLYGIPGDAGCIYEFDPQSQKAEIVFYFDKGKQQNAKCAGGAIDRRGNIWAIPAKGEYIYKLVFNNKSILTTEERTEMSPLNECY